MDKDQAIDFIIRQYTMGYNKEDIAKQLSQQLGAPQAVVAKFVAQTVDQNFPDLPITPLPAPVEQPASPPASFSPASFYTEAEPETALATEDEGFIDLDVPDMSAPYQGAYQDSQDAYTYADSSNTDNAYGAYGLGAQDSATQDYGQEEEQDYDQRSVGYGGPAYEMPAASGGLSEASLYDPTYNLGPAAPAQAAPQASSPSAGMEDDPEVVNLVIKALGKNTKQSDVILTVCENYGLDYKEAQRLVARIHAKNRKAVASRQNLLIIPMCVLAMLGGLALLVMGVLEAFDVRAAYLHASSATDPILLNESSYFIRRIIPQALFGIGLLAGGAFGLFKSIRAQTE